MQLFVREWGDPSAPPVVCLHGVGSFGERFRRLAEERLGPRFRVVALDLRGHGDSGREPPWDLPTHVGDVLETVAACGIERAAWIGHSFGGRLVIELAATARERVERVVLLDPAVRPAPGATLAHAEKVAADAPYASLDEALEDVVSSGYYRRAPRALIAEELLWYFERSPDGRFRPRYTKGAYLTALSEVVTPPPPLEHVRLPTLLVVAEVEPVVSPEQVEEYERALGDVLEVVTVPGGHSVFMDAFEETAAAIERFLG